MAPLRRIPGTSSGPGTVGKAHVRTQLAAGKRYSACASLGSSFAFAWCMVWNFRTLSDPVRLLSVATPCLLSMLLSTQGPFPPPVLPGFPGTTDPSATLTARPAPRGVPVDLCCISVRASRVAALFLFHACRRQYPDGNGSVPVSLASPSANGLPLLTGGSASVLPVSRPARRSLAFRPAWSLNRPRRPFLPECFSPCRYLHDPPWLLPTGATAVGRDSHPPEEGAFSRRTVKDGVK